MNQSPERTHSRRDPLGLRDLPPLTTAEDHWPAIEKALLRQHRNRRRAGIAARWLAAAASLVLVLGPGFRAGAPAPGAAVPRLAIPAATETKPPASITHEDTLESLIAMSQLLEMRVRRLREGPASIPAEPAVYVAELQDLVAQVDNELSFSPGSLSLWGQRVNLLLDLAQVYQHQWEREYGRIASL